MLIVLPAATRTPSEPTQAHAATRFERPASKRHTRSVEDGGERPLIITLTYDYANRRAGKRVQEKIDGAWQELQHHRYVYNGASLIAEIDAATRQVLRAFSHGATGELLMISE